MALLRSVVRFAGASVALLTPELVLGGVAPQCPGAVLSCHNTTAQADTCCFNAPGGQMLQTQFWDFNPATGPVTHWTTHGLWPDHCDGTYDSYCDASRQYTNITQILQSFGKTTLLSYMEKYWKDYQGNDEGFWEHEWGKHGTCISTLDTKCYTDYTPQQEVVDYFQRTMNLFLVLDTYKFLADANIVPSTTKNYTLAEIQGALKTARGVDAVVQCSRSGALQEAWYFYDVRGNIAHGQFSPQSPVGSSSYSCPATNIAYLPKNTSSYPASTTPAAGTVRL